MSALGGTLSVHWQQMSVHFNINMPQASFNKLHIKEVIQSLVLVSCCQ